MTALRVNADDRTQLEAAMREIVKQIRRMPSHWVDERTRLHGMRDALLDDWQAASPARS